MLIQPYLPVQRGDVRVSNLTVINAILLSPKMAVNGGPCRHVSASGARGYTRMRRWAHAGVLDRLFDALQD